MLNRRQFVKRGCIWAGATALGPMVLQAAPPALVQQAAITDSAGDAFGLAPVNFMTGNSIIAIVSHPSTETTDGVSLGPDTAILGPSATVAGIKVEIWYVHNGAGGSRSFEALTVSGSGRISINASEWSGLANAAPEGTNTNTGLLSSTVTTGSATPVSAANLVVGAGAWTANDYSSGPTNSFTRLTQTGGGLAWQEGAYLIQAAATVNSTGWALTAGINWAAVIAVFGAPTTSGPTNAQRSAGFWVMP